MIQNKRQSRLVSFSQVGSFWEKELLPRSGSPKSPTFWGEEERRNDTRAVRQGMLSMSEARDDETEELYKLIERGICVTRDTIT